MGKPLSLFMAKEDQRSFCAHFDKRSEGTGVGLTIVKRIIKVHRGRFGIESELEKRMYRLVYIGLWR